MSFRNDLNRAIDMVDQAPAEAVTMLDRLIAEHPDETQPRFERAMALLNLDRDEEALATLTDLLARSPHYPGARAWTARTLAALGRFSEAAAAWRETMLRRDTTEHGLNPVSWAQGGDYYLQAGDPAGALDLIEIHSTRGGVSTAPIERVRAKALLQLGRADEALAAAEAACEQTSSAPVDLFLRAEALAAVGRLDEALSAFLAAEVKYSGTEPHKRARAARHSY